MLLNRDRALAVFRKVEQIREEYRTYILNPNMNILSVEDFQRTVQQMYEVEIIKTEVPYHGELTRGLIERSNGKVIVRVRKDMSDDWKAFTSVKEICHVVIDKAEDWSPKGVETISDLLAEYFLERDKEADRTTQSEVLAEIAALELLYPFECRGADLVQLKNGKTTTTKIAGYHRMPEPMVSKVLSDQYHDNLATPLWEELKN